MEKNDITWRILGTFERACEDNDEVEWTYNVESNTYALHVLSVIFLIYPLNFD
jgi:hypothetical protein